MKNSIQYNKFSKKSAVKFLQVYSSFFLICLSLITLESCHKKDSSNEGNNDGQFQSVSALGNISGGSQAANPIDKSIVIQNEIKVTPNAVQTYARQLAISLAGRTLNSEERLLLTTGDINNLGKLVDRWLSEPFFINSFRSRIETLIGTSGSRDGIDFDLPGNLAAYIVKQNLPISSLVTSSTCVDSELKPTACDSGAPYNAGVLTMRGYLVAHTGRFNLRRAIATMDTFACTSYPMDEGVQPRIAREFLIDNFRISSQEEAAERQVTGFGNGLVCYTCHGQFAAHTQFFIKFDNLGLYQNSATGQQDTSKEFGQSTDGLFASHFFDPNQSGDEGGNMFGKTYNNLALAMGDFVKSPLFIQCMARNAIAHSFNLDSESTRRIPIDLLAEVIKPIYPGDPPTVAALYKSVLLNRFIIQAFARGVNAP